MNVVIVASGSHGDVAPYAGLGVRLREAGHEVSIAAHAPTAELVTGAGLGFHELPGDLLSVISVPAADRPTPPWYLNRRIPQLSRYLLAVAEGTIEATRDAEVVLVGAPPRSPCTQHKVVVCPAWGCTCSRSNPPGRCPAR
ncbi:MAG: glycosyltransferase [Kineosporiaceae bacterium]|nr:glycosyltransferase [Kineosporiaceae bacterium]